MLRSLMVVALVAGLSVMSSGSVLAAVEVTCDPVAPVQPVPGGLWSFNGSGTFTMGAGTTLWKVVVYLEEKRADGKWYPYGTEIATTEVTGNPPQSGIWSVTFATNYNPAFSYRMKSVLYGFDT